MINDPDAEWFALTDAQRERIEDLWLNLNGRALLCELADDGFNVAAWRDEWRSFRDLRVAEYAAVMDGRLMEGAA